MVKFKKGFQQFKVFHNTKWNIIFHLLTSVLQISFGVAFVMTFNFWYILGIILIPYITDGIGHKLEKNLTIVLLMSKVARSTNSAGVNGFYNFLYRIMLFHEKFFKIKY